MREIGTITDLYSVDISKECYREHGKRTGYAVDMMFDKLPDGITHRWCLGNLLPFYLEEIGGEIDMLILDTVHSMPDEMLDFLAALPFLSSNAVVILHDITLNQITSNEFSYATRLVYDVVVAEKLLQTMLTLMRFFQALVPFKFQKILQNMLKNVSLPWQ